MQVMGLQADQQNKDINKTHQRSPNFKGEEVYENRGELWEKHEGVPGPHAEGHHGQLSQDEGSEADGHHVDELVLEQEQGPKHNTPPW